jgi:Zn-dependent M28 family amino/carboxypeptidase
MSDSIFPQSKHVLVGPCLKLSILSALIYSSMGNAATPINTSALRAAVTTSAIYTHLSQLYAIANANNGTRASGTPGYKASADYIVSKLPTNYFTITRQTFNYQKFTQLSDPTVNRVSPSPVTYVYLTDYATFDYSGAGDVTGTVVPAGGIILPPTANPSSASGCSPADFIPASTSQPQIALVQRGSCNFSVKVINAQNAGYKAIIIFNEGNPGRTDLIQGTLENTGTFTIPAIGASYAMGKGLYDLSQAGPVSLHVKVDSVTAQAQTENIIAETKAGRADRVVMAGGHLDSVDVGPGINDNGSGVGSLLEIAMQMSNLNIKPVNKVRFTWWAAEESGSVGSLYYVASLPKKEILDIAVYLNFDMVASPNFIREVYTFNGNPAGSKAVTQLFTSFFDSQGLTYQLPPTDDGRSDHASFSAVGIPVGGLFSGADTVKTHQEFLLFGGTEGAPLDACYHKACDDISNLNMTVLDQLSDAMAHAILTFANTTSDISGTDKGKAKGVVSEWQGPLLVK